MVRVDQDRRQPGPLDPLQLRLVLEHPAQDMPQPSERGAEIVTAASGGKPYRVKLHDKKPALDAIAELPPAEREAFMLVAWDGLTTAEAAEVLAAKRAQVHQRTWPVEHRFAADRDLAGGRRIDQRHRGDALLGGALPE